MRIARILLAALCALTLALAACSPLDAGELPSEGVAGGDVDAKVVAAQNAFGFELLKEVAAGEASGDVFLSPASASSALLLAYGGAKGDAKAAMARTLGVAGLSDEQVDASYANLLATLMGEGEGTLTIANSVWTDMELEPAFVERNGKYYAANVSANDAAELNEWVSKRTGGRIPKLVDPQAPPPAAHLVNATYFKADWVDAFDEKATSDEDFTGLDGSKRKVPLMQAGGDFRYFEDASLQAVRLLYKRKGMAMYVLLPKAADGLGKLAGSLGAGEWDAVRGGVKEREGRIWLPRFSMRTEHDLTETLKAMGMTDAMDPAKADFSAMTTEEAVFIGKVLQKTFLQVDEEGTEAAAATDVQMLATAVPGGPPPFEMRCDRPFVTLIVHEPTGAILFLGVVNDPKPAE